MIRSSAEVMARCYCVGIGANPDAWIRLWQRMGSYSRWEWVQRWTCYVGAQPDD